MGELLYFSSTSENTHRFVEKLGLPARRIPQDPAAEPLKAREPYILVLPTYGGGGSKGAVPKPVIHFLNDPHNRALIRGRHRRRQHQLRRGLLPGGRIVAQNARYPCSTNSNCSADGRRRPGAHGSERLLATSG